MQLGAAGMARGAAWGPWQAMAVGLLPWPAAAPRLPTTLPLPGLVACYPAAAGLLLGPYMCSFNVCSWGLQAWPGQQPGGLGRSWQ
jgi:hypothetical protein